MALRQTFSLCLPTCPTVVLPGYDTKRWRRQLGTDGVLSLMGKTGRRTAHFVSQVGAYLGAGNYYIGRGAIVGSISDSAIVSERTIQGVRMTSPWFFHSIFVPDGSRHTLAEMDVHEFVRYDYKRKAVMEFLGGVTFRVDRQLELPF